MNKVYHQLRPPVKVSQKPRLHTAVRLLTKYGIQHRETATLSQRQTSPCLLQQSLPILGTDTDIQAHKHTHMYSTGTYSQCTVPPILLTIQSNTEKCPPYTLHSGLLLQVCAVWVVSYQVWDRGRELGSPSFFKQNFWRPLLPTIEELIQITRYTMQ